MKFLLPIAVIVAAALVYALWGREWLKTKTWAQPFFAWVEPIEILLFKKSETILFARLKVFGGVALTYLVQASQIDWTPILPFIPEKYHFFVNAAISSLPLLLSLLGVADEKQRYTATKPIELVAVPEVGLTPEVKVAIAQAEDAKELAVAVVKDKVI
jgi:hypothetical protein